MCSSKFDRFKLPRRVRVYRYTGSKVESCGPNLARTQLRKRKSKSEKIKKKKRSKKASRREESRGIAGVTLKAVKRGNKNKSRTFATSDGYSSSSNSNNNSDITTTNYRVLRTCEFVFACMTNGAEGQSRHNKFLPHFPGQRRGQQQQQQQQRWLQHTPRRRNCHGQVCSRCTLQAERAPISLQLFLLRENNASSSGRRPRWPTAAAASAPTAPPLCVEINLRLLNFNLKT
uniref:Uncharacterized protein n=1 Tax=Trichogramma kaykai TaxID=54128 RepID=A0ABD2X4X2_9HYME